MPGSTHVRTSQKTRRSSRASSRGAVHHHGDSPLESDAGRAAPERALGADGHADDPRRRDPGARTRDAGRPRLAVSGVERRIERLSARVTHYAGSSWAIFIAVAVVLVWLLTGPLFHFSDTWQLVINTGTTVVTFLMVFLIQR